MTSDASLNTCGCGCGGVGEHLPALYNRPGLPSLAYRAGTHGSFLARMVQELSTTQLADGVAVGRRPLAALSTRAQNDPTIALMDAWAVVGDVLTFYQERIANESFLRTATERRSVLFLARAIGYELNPGVAASTWLAFTVESAEGAPQVAVVPAGTKVLSIPAPGQLPQTFETSIEQEVRAEWNALRPQQTAVQELGRDRNYAYLQGVATQLQPGDSILFVDDDRERYVGSERWDIRVLQTVKSEPAENRTYVAWEPVLGSEKPFVLPADHPRLFAFRLRTALFGHNAPDWRTMPDSVKAAFDPAGRQRTLWPDFQIQDNVIDLDNSYPKVLKDSWVALVRASYIELYRASKVVTDARTDYSLTAQVTRITPDTLEHLSFFGLRDTVVLAQSEELALAGLPIDTPVEGSVIDLDSTVAGLQPGQSLAVVGKPAGDPEGATVSEIAVISSVVQNAGHTRLMLKKPLQHSYQRDNVTINGNVVAATHGETVQETLGSGDRSQTFQHFTLKRWPVTHTTATNASGAVSSLTLRVNGLAWNESPALYGAGPNAESYVARIDDNAKSTVMFGDGQAGSRLPTGQENVTATYRFGSGPVGEVKQGALSLLPSRPFGVRGVTNPVPATGAAAAETLDGARTNAPLTVLTLDRIVALQDFEDFARAFAGVGKAQAVALWNGETRVVHITVATATGGTVDPASALYTNLLAAINGARDPAQHVQVASFQALTFDLKANVAVDPRLVADDVLAAVRTALSAAFAFASRGFGQAVTAAEVITVIQNVAGVRAVDLDKLYLTGDAAGANQTHPASILGAQAAHREGSAVVPAQLLLINTAGIDLRKMPL